MKALLENEYLQIVLRCVAVYAFVIVAIRIFGKKELAQLSVTDLVFILLISNSVQNAMVGPDTSLEGGLIAALSLFIVNFILKKILYRNKKMSELLQGKSVMLIYKGELQEQNLKHAEITQFDFFATDKAVHNDIKRFLDDPFDINLFNTSHIRNFQNNIFFRHLTIPPWL